MSDLGSVCGDKLRHHIAGWQRLGFLSLMEFPQVLEEFGQTVDAHDAVATLTQEGQGRVLGTVSEEKEVLFEGRDKIRLHFVPRRQAKEGMEELSDLGNEASFILAAAALERKAHG